MTGVQRNYLRVGKGGVVTSVVEPSGTIIPLDMHERLRNVGINIDVFSANVGEATVYDLKLIISNNATVNTQQLVAGIISTISELCATNATER